MIGTLILFFVFALLGVLLVAAIEIYALKKEGADMKKMYEFWDFYQAKNQLCDAEIEISRQSIEIMDLKMEIINLKRFLKKI